MKKQAQRKGSQNSAGPAAWRRTLAATTIRVITAALVILMHHEQ
ncbi:hypothetical protein [Streptomyces iakyrus]